MFGPKGDEATGELRKLHNQILLGWFNQEGWAEQDTEHAWGEGGARNTYIETFWSEGLVIKDHLGNLDVDGMDFFETVNYNELAEDMVQWRTIMIQVINIRGL